MQLTKRLFEIATCVPQHATVIDVGTDHGYIPIHLTQHQPGVTCIASDINQGPLDSAKRHMDKYGITGIELRRGSGLSTARITDALDTAIIAGMGGLLIIAILKNDLAVVKGLKRLIIQPQNNLPEVRKYLHTIGFAIQAEKFLEDEGKYYTILVAEPGEEQYTRPYEYEYGKYLLMHPNPTFEAWFAHKAVIFEKIEQQLMHADEAVRTSRLETLQHEINDYKEAMQCLQSNNS